MLGDVNERRDGEGHGGKGAERDAVDRHHGGSRPGDFIDVRFTHRAGTTRQGKELEYQLGSSDWSIALNFPVRKMLPTAIVQIRSKESRTSGRLATCLEDWKRVCHVAGSGLESGPLFVCCAIMNLILSFLTITTPSEASEQYQQHTLRNFNCGTKKPYQ